jgi:hypothetical protein
MKQPFLLLSLGKESRQRILDRSNAVRLRRVDFVDLLRNSLERAADSKELVLRLRPLRKIVKALNKA